MIYDFYLLEQYYEAPQTVQFFENLSERYGVKPIRDALAAGYLVRRRVLCGHNAGKIMFWLSDKGRKAAAHA